MYAFTQDLPITPEIWERIKGRIGNDPIPGMVCHLVTRSGNGLRYTDVWESKEAAETFLDSRVHPILDDIFGGQQPSEPPTTVLEVVDFMGASGGVRLTTAVTLEEVAAE